MKINGSIWAGRALLAAFLLSFLMGSAQQPVSLDSCRQMALKNNKQLRIAEEKVKGAGYTKKSARGAYFPGIDFTGSYMYNQKSISLLESDQYLPTKTFDLASQEYKYNVVTNPGDRAAYIEQRAAYTVDCRHDPEGGFRVRCT